VPNSVPLEGEDFTPILKHLLSQSEQPTIQNLPPHVAPIGVHSQFLQQSHSTTIQHLHGGKGFISDHPSERNQLPKGIQEADKTAKMVLSDDWEVMGLGLEDMASVMVAAYPFCQWSAALPSMTDCYLLSVMTDGVCMPTTQMKWVGCKLCLVEWRVCQMPHKHSLVHLDKLFQFLYMIKQENYCWWRSCQTSGQRSEHVKCGLTMDI
jgi:hypothetical protein